LSVIISPLILRRHQPLRCVGIFAYSTILCVDSLRVCDAFCFDGLQLAGVGVLALSIWLLFDQAVVFMAKGAQDYATGTYILLAAGALMTVIGFLGCCGALRENQCLLGTVSVEYLYETF
jgi:hypothetical protein